MTLATVFTVLAFMIYAVVGSASMPGYLIRAGLCQSVSRLPSASPCPVCASRFRCGPTRMLWVSCPDTRFRRRAIFWHSGGSGGSRTPVLYAHTTRIVERISAARCGNPVKNLLGHFACSNFFSGKLRKIAPFHSKLQASRPNPSSSASRSISSGVTREFDKTTLP